MKSHALPNPSHAHRWLLIWLWFMLRDTSPPSGFR
jgi:hypothetical protein